MGIGGRMKAPKNFMKFPYNLLVRATIEKEEFINNEIIITLKAEKTWLFKKLKKWLQGESEER